MPPRVLGISDWLAPLFCFVIIFLIRKLCIGTAIPAGTGGSQVTETFTVRQAILYALQQVQYIFGMNVGPAYLSGITWAECLPRIHRLVHLSWVPLFAIICAYLAVIRKRGLLRRSRFRGTNVLFLLFLALCIGCSSVTIRLEMRWIYVSYAGALLYLGYMIGTITDGVRQQYRMALILAGCFAFYCLAMAPVEKYYRTFFSELYFWENQDRMNSLAEETVEKYGVDGVLGKQVYILENSYGMSDFYGRTFFKVYDPERTGQGTEIHFIDSTAALPPDASPDNTIVLREVPAERGYEEITAAVFAAR